MPEAMENCTTCGRYRDKFATGWGYKHCQSCGVKDEANQGGGNNE